ncbi:ParB/RepB/Spo0J family partition protein [Sorangium sp. So ce131]|uniref:ParB/RepB/Spo0J family partition protein n=1 Tax=Sorangium sp. So ce131 TaxID=3133282 RepID=UPI003F5E9CEA
MTTSIVSAAEALAEPSDRQIFNLPCARIRPSPTQPRTVGRDGADLVDSIRERGVLEPICVRTLEGGWFELVYGERRWRASMAAGRDTVPGEIRDDLRNDEVVYDQNIENAKRLDVGPLDEARSYALLRTRFGLASDVIARRVHKSERHVLQRLQLLRLPSPAQEALTEGKLHLTPALAIAGLESEADRLAAFAFVLPEGADESPYPPRAARRAVETRFHLRLSEVQWNRDDATLLPDAGSCTRCPKRSGNQIALWAEGDEADRCTDRTCFEAKGAAHWQRERAAAEQRGQEVLEGAAAKELYPYGHWLSGKASRRYVELDEPCHELALGELDQQAAAPGGGDLIDDLEELGRGAAQGPAPTWRAVLGDNAPATTVVRDAVGKVHHLVDRQAALARLRGPKEVPASSPPTPPPPEPPQAPAQRRGGAETEIWRSADRKAWLAALAAFADAAARGRAGAAFWRFCAALLLKILDPPDLDVVCERRGLPVSGAVGQERQEAMAAALLGDVGAMTEGAARGLAVELLALGHWTAGSAGLRDPESPARDIARFYNVDLEQLQEAALQEAQAEATATAAPRRRKRKRAQDHVEAPPADPSPPRACAGGCCGAAALARELPGCEVCGCRAEPGTCSVCADVVDVVLEVVSSAEYPIEGEVLATVEHLGADPRIAALALPVLVARQRLRLGGDGRYELVRSSSACANGCCTSAAVAVPAGEACELCGCWDEPERCDTCASFVEIVVGLLSHARLDPEELAVQAVGEGATSEWLARALPVLVARREVRAAADGRYELVQPPLLDTRAPTRTESGLPCARLIAGLEGEADRCALAGSP